MILRVVHILTSASKSSEAWREITLACLSCWSIVSGQDVPTVWWLILVIEDVPIVWWLILVIEDHRYRPPPPLGVARGQ